jgi:hypothetical protein
VSAIEVVKYIVIQKILGNEKALCVLRNYLNGVSPSIIMGICGATRNEVTGYLQRIRERSGNLYRGYIVAKYAIQYIDAVPTLLDKNEHNGKMDGRCPFCKRYSFNLPYHINMKHGNDLQKYIDIMVEVLRDKVNNGKKIKNT